MYSVVLTSSKPTAIAGNKADWASPKDQKAWFADVSGAIIGSG